MPAPRPPPNAPPSAAPIPAPNRVLPTALAPACWRSGAAQAQYSAAYIQQQYNAYYAQCMAARQAQYREPPPGSAPGYAPPSSAAPYPGSTADQLNQQEMNQYSQPAYPGYPPQH